MLTPLQLRQGAAESVKTARAIAKRAEEERRVLTAGETNRVDTLLDDAAELTAKADEIEQKTYTAASREFDNQGSPLNRLAAIEADLNQSRGHVTAPLHGQDSAADPGRWVDQHGKPIHVLSREQSFVSHVRATQDCGKFDPAELSLGRLIRGAFTGNWRGCENEQAFMAAQGSVPWAGGYLIPDQIVAGVIDLARNQSVVMRAGAQLINLTSDTCRIVRIKTDPVFTAKGESEEFDTSEVVFDAINLIPQKIGCVIPIPIELVEDSPNAGQAIQDALTRSLATEIDRLALVGSGSEEPLGVTKHTGVQTIAVGGAVDWDDLLDAIEDCETYNHMPNAYITSPGVKNSLAKLKVAAEANHYATAPPEVASLMKLVTNNAESGELYLGDFRHVLFGLRQGPQLAFSTDADSAFSKYEQRIRLVYRFDVALARSEALVVLSGIT